MDFNSASVCERYLDFLVRISSVKCNKVLRGKAGSGACSKGERDSSDYLKWGYIRHLYVVNVLPAVDSDIHASSL